MYDVYHYNIVQILVVMCAFVHNCGITIVKFGLWMSSIALDHFHWWFGFHPRYRMCGFVRGYVLLLPATC